MSQPSGYSGTPLAKKLGVKDGHVVGFAGLPGFLARLKGERAFAHVDDVPDWSQLGRGDYDVAHVFTDKASVARAALSGLKSRIKQDGMIWMSWPKKASKVPTDVTEDVIRKTALADVLVDVKVCAVDDVWSGLKLVIRKELRA